MSLLLIAKSLCDQNLGDWILHSIEHSILTVQNHYGDMESIQHVLLTPINQVPSFLPQIGPQPHPPLLLSCCLIELLNSFSIPLPLEIVTQSLNLFHGDIFLPSRVLMAEGAEAGVQAALSFTDPVRFSCG